MSDKGKASRKDIDKYGDIWDKIGDYLVIRRKDGNIGLYDKGKGLKKL